MPPRPGDRFGPYEIVARIGAGGMGEVYRARDTRLNRDVALKVLSPEFATDPTRRRRFEQEARAVAALNHPNIVAVYDVGDGFLVSELLEGQTLRHAGKLSDRQALNVAAQIAEGLAAAHGAGITHRDLKPENIMITREGRAKILDFGLAKSTKSAPKDSEPSTETQEGAVLGTVSYMSPEQVKGQAADPRSDIFSFGLVLYEMLAGHRAFTAGSNVEVMSAILRDETPDLPPRVSPHLKAIVAHCIEKNPERRFQSARDLAFALEMPPPAAAAREKGGARKWSWPVAIAVLIALASASFLFMRVPVPLQWAGLMLGGPEMALNPRQSPDGHLLAFAVMVDGLTQVAVMKPESGNWTVLTHDRTHGQVFDVAWSPDGALIYYNRSRPRAVYSVPVLGGDEHLVLENAGNAEALTDGTLIVVRPDAERRRRFCRFWPGTGRLDELPIESAGTASQNTHARSRPGGKSVLLWGEPVGRGPEARGLYDLDLASASMRRVSPVRWNANDVVAFAPRADGKSILAAVNSGALTRITSLQGSVERTMFTVTSGVWYLDSGADGSVYVSMLARPSELLRFAADGSGYERLAEFPLVPEDAGILAVLPDGRGVVAVRSSGVNRLMVVQKGKDPAVLVNTTEETSAPLAACGPNDLAFVIGPAPHETIAFTEPASGRLVRKVGPGKGPIDSIACSPDGGTMYFGAGGVIWSIPAIGVAAGSATTGGARRIWAGKWIAADPEGRRLIVQDSQFQLFDVPLDGSAGHEIRVEEPIRIVSTGALRADGRLLIPLAPPDSWFNPPGVIDIATGRVRRIPAESLGDYRSMAWARDDRVMVLKNGLQARIWRFQPTPGR